MLAVNMSYHWDEEAISEEELASIQLEVEKLINRILDSDFDDDLKTILIDGLDEIREAIVDYRLLGAEAIRKAVDRNFGVYNRNKEYLHLDFVHSSCIG